MMNINELVLSSMRHILLLVSLLLIPITTIYALSCEPYTLEKAWYKKGVELIDSKDYSIEVGEYYQYSSNTYQTMMGIHHKENESLSIKYIPISKVTDELSIKYTPKEGFPYLVVLSSTYGASNISHTYHIYSDTLIELGEVTQPINKYQANKRNGSEKEVMGFYEDNGAFLIDRLTTEGTEVGGCNACQKWNVETLKVTDSGLVSLGLREFNTDTYVNFADYSRFNKFIDETVVNIQSGVGKLRSLLLYGGVQDSVEDDNSEYDCPNQRVFDVDAPYANTLKTSPDKQSTAFIFESDNSNDPLKRNQTPDKYLNISTQNGSWIVKPNTGSYFDKYEFLDNKHLLITSKNQTSETQEVIDLETQTASLVDLTSKNRE